MTKMLLNLCLSLLLLLYPLWVYMGLQQGAVLALPVGLGLLFGLRFLAMRRWRHAAIKPLTRLAAVGALLGMTLSLLSLVLKEQRWLLWYPVGMNLMMLLAFGLTLCRPPSMIEWFARIKTPVLPPSGVRYTRHITYCWCALFVLNTVVASALALLNWYQAWVWYNGVIAYVLMGSLLVGEWLFRRLFLPRIH